MLSSISKPYKALIFGSTGGIGQAICSRLENDPDCAQVIGLSRKTDPAIDLTDPTSLEQAAEFVRQKHDEIDALIVATGVLMTNDGSGPEKAFSQIDADYSHQQFAINAIGPALVFKHFMPLLGRKGRKLVATLSARVGSIGDNGLGGWISYRASKAALNQITHTAAIELSRKNKESVCVALHPGTIETDLSRPLANGNFTHTPDECAENLLTVLNNLKPEQTGGFFDYSGESIVW